MIVSELNHRLGGDPRGFPEYSALREEILKLNHPARPDVDWLYVEQLCLTLHRDNGPELQSLVMMALARANLYGLAGAEEGLATINQLLGNEWTKLWPLAVSARLELLCWLFDQLQPLLRRLELTTDDLSLARQLFAELGRVAGSLEHCTPAPLVALQSLRQQTANLLKRLERDSMDSDSRPYVGILQAGMHRVSKPMGSNVISVQADGSAGLIVVALEDKRLPEPPTQRSRLLVISIGVVLLLGALLMAVAYGWHKQSLLEARQAAEQAQRQSIQFESLPFAPGSAELQPQVTKALVNALMHVNIKANWLVVITGHSDNSGDSQQNLVLSHARAAAVKDWVQQMSDLPDSCFVVRGAGATQPIAENNTREGRAANRRVDVQLHHRQGDCA
ncbi:OmpA family protein [Pseudomonas mosselii]|uniref:OmpA family protein n=1 Tax=Pseudomonas mosselii TaxID=78327 RepID=UPI003F3A0A43